MQSHMASCGHAVVCLATRLRPRSGCYCCCRDMGVGTNYPYPFGSGSTCRVLLIRRGESDRVCPMTVVSNQSIDDREMGSFMEYTKSQRMPLMTRAHVKNVAAALKTAEK